MKIDSDVLKPARICKIKGFKRGPLQEWFPHFFYTSTECFYEIEMRKILDWHYIGDLKSTKPHPTDPTIKITQATQRKRSQF